MGILENLQSHGVVPVIAIQDAQSALPLVDALAEGGLPVAEITFRTNAALRTIEQIAVHRPEVLVGAGTVLTVEQLHSAKNAGAKFGLSPGLDAKLVEEATRAALPFIPGIMTPSDLIAGINLGCSMFKFFPAGAAGGPKMLKSIAAPFAHMGIGFNPTGGIGPTTINEWLSMESVRAVGGTWIASQKDIAEQRWDKITANAKEAVQAVASARGMT